jgi:hypothetical protein
VLESVIVSQDKHKPVFDEQTLAKLLEAAFILQEHGHELRTAEANLVRKRDFAPVQRAPELPAPRLPAEILTAPAAEPEEFITKPQIEHEDYSSTLAQIVETGHQMEVRRLKGDEALSLIASQLIEICGAAGAAIGIVRGKLVRYRAIAGIRTLPAGSEVPVEKALCAPCLRSGQVFSCADLNPQSRNDSGECRRRGIGSLIIVPVLREADVIGALELYYSDPRAFTEQDGNTCQLMAGLVTEVLAGEEIAAPTADTASSIASHDNAASDRPLEQDSDFSPPRTTALCHNCGQKLVGEEQFCGECGAARTRARRPVSTPNKAVPFWLQARKREPKSPAMQVPGEPRTDATQANSAASESDESSLPTTIATVNLQSSGGERSEPVGQEIVIPEVHDAANTSEADAAPSGEVPVPSPDWSSALSTRQFLEQLAAGNRKNTLVQFWNARRGDIYLGIAVILVICAIRWGIWSNRPVSATAAPATTAENHKQPAQPELSRFDRMLISLGLAEAPAPPEDKGNPVVQVWIDLHTGLYYCAGTDLYGKTPKGKYATQRDAQLDQFQPAYRRPCD